MTSHENKELSQLYQLMLTQVSNTYLSIPHLSIYLLRSHQASQKTNFGRVRAQALSQLYLGYSDVCMSDRFPKNMPAILVHAVCNAVFINPDIYWHRMFETEQGMP